MNCNFREIKPGVFACDGCNQSQIETNFSKDQIRRSCKNVKKASGVGTELTELLRVLGMKHRPGCKCRKRAALMNKRGPVWCRENIDKITGWLEEEAKARKLPFSRIIGRQIIWLAIRRAERNSSRSVQT